MNALPEGNPLHKLEYYWHWAWKHLPVHLHRFGMKKGNITRAIEEAIRLWIDAEKPRMEIIRLEL